MLWGTGRPTQFPGWVRINITPLGAFMGVEHHLGDVARIRRRRRCARILFCSRCYSELQRRDADGDRAVVAELWY